MRDGLPEADDNGGTGRSISITMRTPGNDAELALGFLYGEGLLREPRDVVDVRPCGPTGNVIRVTVRADLPLDLDAAGSQFLHHLELRRVRQGLHRRRHRQRRHCAASSSDLVVRESVLRGLPETLRASQAGFAETGGMHAVGLVHRRGRVAREPRRRGPPQRHGQAGRRRVA